MFSSFNRIAWHKSKGSEQNCALTTLDDQVSVMIAQVQRHRTDECAPILTFPVGTVDGQLHHLFFIPHPAKEF